MENILTYVKDNMKTFDDEPFNEVDSIIFSWVSYLSFPAEFSKIRAFDGMSFRDIYQAEHFEHMQKTVKSPEDTILLLSYIACSPRFRNVRLFRYSEDLNPAYDKQFAALTYEYQPGRYYVAFRGTDSSFAGWKEDMNLTYIYPVPAQDSARAYLDEIGSHILTYSEILFSPSVSPQIRVGGHSKGGNLAIYASLKCQDSVRDLITHIYSHDGPGFMPEVVHSEEYDRIKGRICKTLPSSSFFGMLLFEEEEPKIIVSHGISVGQHNPFTWQVEGDHFEEAGRLSTNAWLNKAAFNDWVLSQTPQERRQFIDTFFDALENSDVDDFDDFNANLKTAVPATARAVRSYDRATRKAFLKTLGLLAKSGIKTFPEVITAELKDFFRSM